MATDYKPTRASSFRPRPALESRTLDGMFDASVALKSVEQPDDGWGAPQAFWLYYWPWRPQGVRGTHFLHGFKQRMQFCGSVGRNLGEWA